MSSFCPAHQFPRAHIDPIDDDRAQLIIASVIDLPLRPEIVAIVVDHQRRGVAIINVDAVLGSDGVHAVVEMVIELGRQQPATGGLILASVRPGGGDELDDVERWLDLDHDLSAAGIELLEWYVIGTSISRPRALLGEPARWTG